MSGPGPADTSYWDVPVEGECAGCDDLEDLDPSGLCSWCAAYDQDDYHSGPQVVSATPLQQYL